MPVFTQANRPLAATTPLGADKMLLISFSGREALSDLFSFTLDVVAEESTDVSFDKLLGQPIGVKLVLPGAKERHFHGICSRISEGERRHRLRHFRMHVVPEVWLLTRAARSRVFQGKSVPDILKDLLAAVKVDFKLQGTFEPRDYCVQYRETDFDFASRLMEEEGIFYYFAHTEGVHTMVVGNAPVAHRDIPETPKVPFEPSTGADREGVRVRRWETTQQLRSGKFALRDHCFELPHNALEASAPVVESVAAGKLTLKTRLSATSNLELYDYPGGYAGRFDGISPSGGDQASQIQKIFTDNKRTVELRMQEETASAIVTDGAANCAQFSAGHRFTLEQHPTGEGAYVFLDVRHSISYPWAMDHAVSDDDIVHYGNAFSCIPAALPYRPARTTRKPVVGGAQTAQVVGPAGEEIFTDKYGRIRVHFFWDREGKDDGADSCWVRVGTHWAGKQWGAIHIPRIGQEVIVDFLEGDPDQPIVVGSVYNAEQMPPYALPDNKTQSGIKSRSSPDGGAANFNELRLEDKKGSEEIYFHAEKDFNRVVENNDTLKVGSAEADEGSQTIEVYKDRTETVKTGNETITIELGDRTVSVNEGNETLTVGKGNRTTTIEEGNETLTVKRGSRTTEITEGDEKLTVGKGNRTTEISAGNETLTVTKGNRTTEIKEGNDFVTVGQGDHALTVNSGSLKMKASAGAASVEGGQSIELKVGGNSIMIDASGITIKGTLVTIEGQATLEAKSPMTTVKGDGMLTLKGGVTMIN